MDITFFGSRPSRALLAWQWLLDHCHQNHHCRVTVIMIMIIIMIMMTVMHDRRGDEGRACLTEVTAGALLRRMRGLAGVFLDRCLSAPLLGTRKTVLPR
jgi:hypothetical protein